MLDYNADVTLLRRWLREAKLAFAIWAVFVVLRLLAVHPLPASDTFKLTPRGRGAVADFIFSVGGVFMLTVLFTAATYRLRRWLYRFVGLVLFVICVVGIVYFEATSYVAAVRTADSFVFVRPFPFGTRTAPVALLRDVSIDANDACRLLHVRFADPQTGAIEEIRCLPVWRTDLETTRVMNQLMESLIAVQSSTPVHSADRDAAMPAR